MTIILYMVHGSPPVRAVLITARALGLDLTLKVVDFFNKEHLTQEFLKLNPQHTVPTLVDSDGFTIWDSHAIVTYLISKYDKNDCLYPKELKIRATVDQRLHFDSSVVFPQLCNITKAVLHGGSSTIDNVDEDGVSTIYGFLEVFLEGKQWIAGDCVTVADYSLIASISSLNCLVPIDGSTYPRLWTWIKNCESLPEYEANQPGLKEFYDVVKKCLCQ